MITVSSSKGYTYIHVYVFILSHSDIQYKREHKYSEQCRNNHRKKKRKIVSFVLHHKGAFKFRLSGRPRHFDTNEISHLMSARELGDAQR